MNTIKKFFNDETGLELTEYAIAAALVVVGLIGVFTSLGGNIKLRIEQLVTATNVTAS